ncbi:hypothetical protein [Pseudomonas sp. KU43P]|uniref:hypothetical protein n=1 Tax=Pseudomonas sp. KU43P TaxID=2487887 RepID=UPI0012A85ABA|nr:hypothetical protein [Pseudomonas sp. KU43P]BBH46497.1 hypothetical protein KU43P_29740 [Pseudomonas sp. KU43P]
MAYSHVELNKYFNTDETITADGVTGPFVSASATKLSIRDPVQSFKTNDILLSDIKLIDQFEEKKARWEQSLEKLVNAGATVANREAWSKLDGILLAETITGDFFFGRASYYHRFNPEYLFKVDKVTLETFKRVKPIYDTLNRWRADEDFIPFRNLANVYVLKDLKGLEEKKDDNTDTETTPPQEPEVEWIPYKKVVAEEKYANWFRTFIIYDSNTGTLLPGSPLSFPLKDHRAKDKWPTFVREQLIASPLGNYLRLGTDKSVDGEFGAEDTLTFWQANLPVQIQMDGFASYWWKSALHTASGQASSVKALIAALAPEGGTGIRTITFTLRDKTSKSPIQTWNHDLIYTDAKDDELSRIDSLAKSVKDHLSINFLFAKPVKTGQHVTKEEEKAEWHLLFTNVLNLELDARHTLPIADTGNDLLPHMTGFEPADLGAGECLWHSPCYLLADRDLKKDEQIHVWAVDPNDGRLLKTVSFTATDKNKGKSDWPKGLINAIQANQALVEDSVLLQAGHLTAEAEFTAAEQSTTSESFSALDEMKKTAVDRLWAFDSLCRLFSNAPFVANQVRTVVLADTDLADGDRVCIQVRHRISQFLYESHLFVPSKTASDGSYSKQLSEHLNKNSSMLRAGALQKDNITIAPADNKNGLWIPQSSDLSVHIEFVNWIKHAPFAADRALKDKEVLWIAVHDDLTGAPLPGSPFKFSAKKGELEKDKWPSALAKQLAASPLAEYLKLEVAAEATGTEKAANVGWWKAGVSLRIWMSEPLEVEKNTTSYCSGLNALHAITDQATVSIELSDERSGQSWPISTFKLNVDASDKAKNMVSLRERIGEALIGADIHWLAIDQPDEIETSDKSHENSDSLKTCVSSAAQIGLHIHIKELNRSQSPFTPFTPPFELQRIWLDGHLLETLGAALRTKQPKILESDTFSDLAENNPAQLFHGFYLDVRQKQTASEQAPALREMLETLEKTPLHRLLDNSVPDPYQRSRLHHEVTFYKSYVRFFIDLLESKGKLGDLASKESGNSTLVKYLDEHYTHRVERVLGRHSWTTIDFRNMPTPFAAKPLHCKPSALVIKLEPDFTNLATPEPEYKDFLIDQLRSLGLDAAPYHLCFALDPQAIKSGVKIVTCHGEGDSIQVQFYTPYRPNERITRAIILAGFTSPHCIWQPFGTCTSYLHNQLMSRAEDTLCPDEGGTRGSEIFDSTAQHLRGVNPKTGLFRASYSLGILRSLNGKCPTIDLSLHYSPLRANESALGDGWAFQFSSYDNLQYVLSLRNGITERIEEEDLKKLISDPPGKLERTGYTLTAIGTSTSYEVEEEKRTYYDLTTLTIQYIDGTVETLAAPKTLTNLRAVKRTKKQT